MTSAFRRVCYVRLHHHSNINNETSATGQRMQAVRWLPGRRGNGLHGQGRYMDSQRSDRLQPRRRYCYAQPLRVGESRIPAGK